MAKRTFAARTFMSFTFRSGTWAGEGGGAPSPDSILNALFCHPFTTAADYTAFIAEFNTFIATPAILSAGDLTYLLQLSGGSTLSTLDRDLWVQLLTRTYLSESERWPFGTQTPTTFEESDPLGLGDLLTLPANHQVIIIDPQNSGAVKVIRGSETNELANQSDVPLGTFLFTGTSSTYNNRLWYNLDSLDETNWSTVINGVTGNSRRFPITSGSPVVTIYVRGGTQTLSKEIHLRQNNPNWFRPNIRIMGYPGDPQRPTINCGSSLIESGTGAGGYRFMYFWTVERSSVRWSGLKTIGYRGAAGSRIFSDKLMVINPAPIFGAEPTPVIYDSEFLDMRGIPSDHLQAATYPEWIDSQYYNRKNHSTGAAINVWNSDNSLDEETLAAVRARTDNVRIERSHARVRSIEGPAFTDPDEPQGELGDGISASTLATNMTVTRCLVDGRTPHQAVQAVTVGAIVTYCDISNPDHTCLAVSHGSVTVEYNRIHDWTTRVGETDAAGVGLQIQPSTSSLTGGSIKGNVFYNASQYEATAAIWLTANAATAFELANLIIEENILYKAAIRYGYTGNNHATSTLVNDITTRNNAIDGVPVGNDAIDAYDAPIITNLYQFPTVMNGVVWINNLVHRYDADTTMVAQSQAAGAQTDHTLAQLNAFTGSSGNYNSLPLFTDADNGDFRLQALSPLLPFFSDETEANMPFFATPAWDEYDLLDLLCGIDQVLCGEVYITGRYTGSVTISARYTGKGHVFTCECD